MNQLKPKLALSSEAIKSELLKQIEQAGGIHEFYTQSGGAATVAQSIIKPFYELLLQAEMDQHLGYKKHSAEGHNTGNTRNGLSSKTVRGDFGELERNPHSRYLSRDSTTSFLRAPY